MTHRGPFQPLTFCDSVRERKELLELLGGRWGPESCLFTGHLWLYHAQSKPWPLANGLFSHLSQPNIKMPLRFRQHLHALSRAGVSPRSVVDTSVGTAEQKGGAVSPLCSLWEGVAR